MQFNQDLPLSGIETADFSGYKHFLPDLEKEEMKTARNLLKVFGVDHVLIADQGIAFRTADTRLRAIRNLQGLMPSRFQHKWRADWLLDETREDPLFKLEF